MKEKSWFMGREEMKAHWDLSCSEVPKGQTLILHTVARSGGHIWKSRREGSVAVLWVQHP